MGGEIIVLDAGTGLRGLGRSLLREFKGKPLNLTLLLTHTHWDHIHGLPFFGPIYDSGCRLRILGSKGTRKGLINALAGQMESTYFPVPFHRLPSNIEIQELKDLHFDVGPVSVQALPAHHPGLCVGYRLASAGVSVAFFPDTEPRGSGQDGKMIDFVRDADLLILDSQYDAAEYRQHVGWGHGCVDDSVALAARAGVKHLSLFHHDPDHNDRWIDRSVAHARRLVARRRAKLRVDAAREGTMIRLPAKSSR